MADALMPSIIYASLQACRMYTTQRSKLQTAVKALLFLCVLLLFFVLINGGLTFMVVHLTKVRAAVAMGCLQYLAFHRTCKHRYPHTASAVLPCLAARQRLDKSCHRAGGFDVFNVWTIALHYIQEVTAQDDGLLFTDKTNQIVSTGKAATVVELLADNHAFSRLLGRNCSRSEHVCKNHLSVKPDGAGIVFSAGTYEIFPCDFMKVSIWHTWPGS